MVMEGAEVIMNDYDEDNEDDNHEMFCDDGL